MTVRHAFPFFLCERWSAARPRCNAHVYLRSSLWWGGVCPEFYVTLYLNICLIRLYTDCTASRSTPLHTRYSSRPPQHAVDQPPPVLARPNHHTSNTSIPSVCTTHKLKRMESLSVGLRWGGKEGCDATCYLWCDLFWKWPSCLGSELTVLQCI